MCGINGFVMLKGNRSDEMLAAIRWLFDEMLVETQDRGYHATGLVAMNRDATYGFHKAATSAKVMTTFDVEYDKIIDGLSQESASIVSHTRWYTKGKPENNLNNHPFDIGSVVGVHNGTIGNDDDLFKKHAEDFTRIAEVDSEIIYQLINHYNKDAVTFDGLKLALEKSLLRGQLALAFVHKAQPNLVHIVKQDRPMDFVMWEEGGIVFFNSEKKFIYDSFDQLRRVNKRGSGFDVGFTLKEYELKSDKYLTLDANAETFDQVFSEPQSIFVTSTATKTYNTASNWTGGTRTGGTGNASTNLTHISAADSIGRVIEGELDTVSGEIIIFTPNSTVGDNDDGVDLNENEDETVWCVECGGELEEHEARAAFNEGAKQTNTFHCSDCHQAVLHTVFPQ